MGFNTEMRKARDRDLPLERRVFAFRRAVRRFSPRGFNNTIENLERAVGVTYLNAWTGAELERAADLLDQSREHYKRHRAEWDNARRKLKAAGTSTVSAAELDAFETDNWFDQISDGPGRRGVWFDLETRVRRYGLTPGPFGPAFEVDTTALFDELPAASLEPASLMLANYGPFAAATAPRNLIRVPSRIYNPPMAESTYDALSPTQRLLADCWYSRSHDGHVRQRHVRRLVAATEHVVVPYVVAALGDYVIEITADVASGLTELHRSNSWQHRAYRTFTFFNPSFMHLTRQRAASYWNEYYRSSHSRDGSTNPVYPAFAVLDDLGRGIIRSSVHSRPNQD